jgi:hypothetical protein
MNVKAYFKTSNFASSNENKTKIRKSLKEQSIAFYLAESTQLADSHRRLVEKHCCRLNLQ